jgi:hypothetical protein
VTFGISLVEPGGGERLASRTSSPSSGSQPRLRSRPRAASSAAVTSTTSFTGVCAKRHPLLVWAGAVGAAVVVGPRRHDAIAGWRPARPSGLMRRSTATPGRNTSSSTSLVEDERPSMRISPSTCWKIRYDNLQRHSGDRARVSAQAERRSSRAFATFWNPTSDDGGFHAAGSFGDGGDFGEADVLPGHLMTSSTRPTKRVWRRCRWCGAPDQTCCSYAGLSTSAPVRVDHRGGEVNPGRAEGHRFPLCPPIRRARRRKFEWLRPDRAASAARCGR